MCLYCNNRGLVTVEKKITVAGISNHYDFIVKCECSDNVPKYDMKYPKDITLNQAESAIYLKMVKDKVAPWDIVCS